MILAIYMSNIQMRVHIDLYLIIDGKGLLNYATHSFFKLYGVNERQRFACAATFLIIDQ